VAEVSIGEVVVLFKQHLELLRGRRDVVWAQLTASQRMVEQSQALIRQIDEQIERMEREIGWATHPRHPNRAQSQSS
jgi:hypothetical protein